MEIPEINERVRQLIDFYANRSVKKFAESINKPQQTVNRLFNIDSRTGKYPVVTTEILVAIMEMYVDVDANWLLSGRGNMLLTKPAESEELAESSLLEDKLLTLLKEKDVKVEELAKEIGKLEAENEYLRKKDIDTPAVEGATCAAANE